MTRNIHISDESSSSSVFPRYFWILNPVMPLEDIPSISCIVARALDKSSVWLCFMDRRSRSYLSVWTQVCSLDIFILFHKGLTTLWSIFRRHYPSKTSPFGRFVEQSLFIHVQCDVNHLIPLTTVIFIHFLTLHVIVFFSLILDFMRLWCFRSTICRFLLFKSN